VARKKLTWIGVAIVLVFALPALDDGCGTHEPWSARRPKTIPREATYVPVVKGYWYVHCWLDPAENVDRCRVYHSDGTLLLDDVYVPNAGSQPIPTERLLISTRTGSNGPRIVYLKGREILISRSDFENQKRFVDGRWKTEIPVR
jgi:hypothetical protein